MKKEYQSPELEIVNYNQADVLFASQVEDFDGGFTASEKFSDKWLKG